MVEFTKSLLSIPIYAYRYDARHGQVLGNSNEKPVTKYAVEGVFTTYAIKRYTK